MALGEGKYVSNFLFGFAAWVKSALGGALVVDAKHSSLCGLSIHVEEAF